jgi:hypothetical protein
MGGPHSVQYLAKRMRMDQTIFYILSVQGERLQL